MPVYRRSAGLGGHGQAIELYTLVNSHDVRAKVANYGATFSELHVHYRAGHFAFSQKHPASRRNIQP